jgi:Protein of unknown function (DUF1488)
MPLTPTSDEPETEGMAVRWAMSNGKRQVVCWVRAAALETLENNLDLAKSDYLNAFIRHRSILEARASAIYDRGLLDGNAVIVRKENI